MTNSLVLDLGAGSGRAMLARFDGLSLGLSEIYRFPGIEMGRSDGPHWDIARLFSEIENCLRAARQHCAKLDSIGVDGWGLDYVLLEASGAVGNDAYHYRHPRSQRGYRAFPIQDEEMFRRTGSQILPINTVYQLYDAAHCDPPQLTADQRILMIADAVNYFLTGQAYGESTLARTSGLVDLNGDWEASICIEAGIPIESLLPLKRAGTVHGPLRPELLAKFGWDDVPVIAVAGHDSASAAYGLPLQPNEAYAIGGSWFILGREIPAPIVSSAVKQAQFGNEGGVEGRSLLTRSINGLHLFQKLCASWQRQTGECVTFEEVAARAAACNADWPDLVLETSDPVFFDPPDLVSTVRDHLKSAGVDLSDGIGPIGLALDRGLVRNLTSAFADLRTITNTPIETVRICGGGAQDGFFCQLIADNTGCQVIAGPIEASAWGNAIVQLIGLGLLPDLTAARVLMAKSIDFTTYYPQTT